MLTSLIAGTFFGVENLAGLVHLFPVCRYTAILDPPARVPFCHNTPTLPSILKNERNFLSLVYQYVFIFSHSCATVPTLINSQFVRIANSSLLFNKFSILCFAS